jgi:hypothetical protein
MVHFRPVSAENTGVQDIWRIKTLRGGKHHGHDIAHKVSTLQAVIGDFPEHVGERDNS